MPPNYDSLVAKLIVSDDDRPSALARAAQALAEFEVEGIATTLPLFREMVDERAGLPRGRLHHRLPRRGGGAAILAVRVMTDTPPRAVSRRQARRAAFVLTYQLDVRAGSDLDELAVRYLADTGMDGAGLHARGRRGRAARPAARSTPPWTTRPRGWTADRLGAVERAILRLATWELRGGELPAAVVIDEAVELAKRYAGAEAAPFVNGVLGAIARGAGRARVSTEPGARRPARADRRRARRAWPRPPTIPDAAVAALTEINELALAAGEELERQRRAVRDARVDE